MDLNPQQTAGSEWFSIEDGVDYLADIMDDIYPEFESRSAQLDEESLPCWSGFEENISPSKYTSPSHKKYKMSSMNSNNNPECLFTESFEVLVVEDALPSKFKLANKANGNHFDDSSEDDEDDASLDENSKQISKSAKNAKAKNRAHAKNTRLRKKKYLSELQSHLSELYEELEMSTNERRLKIELLADKIKTCRRAVIVLLELRVSGCSEIAKWSEIIEPDIRMVLPITPYRSFPPTEIIEYRRHMIGYKSVIADAASFSLMIQSLGHHQENGDKILSSFYCDEEEISVVDGQAMSQFSFQTANAVALGSRCEVYVEGMLVVKFSKSNKIIYFELIFDVMNLMQQLRKATFNLQRPEFQVVPNTFQIAQENCADSRLVMELYPPHEIIYVNRNWCEAFGYSQDSMKRSGISSIMSPSHRLESEKFYQLLQSVKDCMSGGAMVFVKPDASGKIENGSETTKCYCKIYPLYADGSVSHILGIMEPIHTVHHSLAINQGRFGSQDGMQKNLDVSDYMSQTSSEQTISLSSRSLGSLESNTSSGTRNSVPTKESQALKMHPPKSLTANLKFKLTSKQNPTPPTLIEESSNQALKLNKSARGRPIVLHETC